MTTPQQESTDAAAEGGAAQRGAGWGRRLLDIYTVENTPVVTLLAIVFALAVGAILIVLSDSSTMAKAGYFFSAPSDFLSSAWGDISNAYTNLFKGAIFNGVETRTYDVPALDAGQYAFVCTVHPTMVGTLNAQ